MAGRRGVPRRAPLRRPAGLGSAGGPGLSEGHGGPARARPRLRAVLGWALPAALVLAAVWFLHGRWDEVRAAGGLPGVAPVAAAAAVHLVANAVSVTTWRRIATVAGARLTWAAAAWVWAASQLARYGLSGAQVAGRAVLGRRYGMTSLAGGVTALVETAWQLAITAVLVLATVPWWLPGADDLRWVALAALVPAAVLVVGSVAPMRLLAGAARLAAWSPVRRVARGRLATSLEGVTLSPGEAARITGLFLTNTALRVVAFVLLLAAVGGSPARDLGVAVGAYAIGQVAGRVAVFAPGGVGAQEGATALVLAPVIGGPVALLLVAVTRLAEVLGEVAFLGLARWRRPVSSPARTR